MHTLLFLFFLIIFIIKNINSQIERENENHAEKL